MENDSVPEMIDHRHLQMRRWLQNRTIRHTAGSRDTSFESSLGSSFDFSLEMSRSIDSPSSRILSSPIGTFVTSPPSTSFAGANNYHDIYSLALPYLQQTVNPPQNQNTFNHHAALLLLHNMKNQQQQLSDTESDVDVVGLVDTTKEVSLNDKDDVEAAGSSIGSAISVITDETPLDLSFASKMESPKASVIRSTGIHHETKKSHTSVRRSMSSVSTSAHEDVVAHFRRSLSGKWPKRNKVEEARNSPLRRRPSFNTHSSITSLSAAQSISPTPPPLPSTPAPSTIVVNNHFTDTSLSVADHFRRALSGKKGWLEWQKKKSQE